MRLMIASVMMTGTWLRELPIDPPATLAVPVNTKAKMTGNGTGRASVKNRARRLRKNGQRRAGTVARRPVALLPAGKVRGGECMWIWVGSCLPGTRCSSPMARSGPGRGRRRWGI